MNNSFLSESDFLSAVDLKFSLTPFAGSCRLVYNGYVCYVFPLETNPLNFCVHNLHLIDDDAVIEVSNEYFLIRYPSKI